MRVKTRLITVFLIIIAFIAAAGFVGTNGAKRIFEAFDEVADKTAPALVALGKIESLVNKIQTEAVSLALIISENSQIEEEVEEEDDDEEEVEEEDEMRKAKEQLGYWINEFDKLTEDDVEKRYTTIIKKNETALFKNALKLISAKRQGKQGEEILEIKEDLEKTEEEFELAIDKAIEYERNKLIAGDEFADDIAGKSVVYSIIISTVSFIFAIGLGLYISYSILKPIIKLRDTIVKIGDGKLETRVAIKSKDEMGQLAASLNNMTEKLQKTTISRDYAENIFKSMTDTLIVVNPDATIKRVNQATFNLLGYRENELIGKPSRMIFAEEEAFERSGIENLIKKGGIRSAEKTYVSKDGREIPVLFSSSVMLDDEGNIQGIVCVAQDITEQKQLKFELVSEKEQLSVTLNSIGDGVIATDDKGGITMLNKISQILTGWPQEEAFGKPLPEVFHIINEKTREIAKNPVYRVLEKGEIVEHANQRALIARDGTERVIAYSAAPMRSNDCNIIGVVLVFSDITERKQLDDERRDMELKMIETSKLAPLGEIATGVAHEINQPLTYISSFIQNLKIDLKEDFIDKNELLQDLTTSHKQVNRIIDIIQHLRTFGRRDDVDMRQVSIETVLDNTLIIMGERIRLSNIEIVKNIEQNLPMVLGNPNQLEQIFINLFQNAMHAFPQNAKKPEISVDMLSTEAGDAVAINITDNGTGIAKEELDRIFEPFFTTKEVGKGTGLGLSIVYGIIKKHNGSISCESEVNKGTKFLITLPASVKA